MYRSDRTPGRWDVGHGEAVDEPALGDVVEVDALEIHVHGEVSAGGELAARVEHRARDLLDAEVEDLATRFDLDDPVAQIGAGGRLERPVNWPTAQSDRTVQGEQCAVGAERHRARAVRERRKRWVRRQRRRVEDSAAPVEAVHRCRQPPVGADRSDVRPLADHLSGSLGEQLAGVGREALDRPPAGGDEQLGAVG